MSNKDIQPYDWFKRFFGQTGRDFFGRDMFREFNDMQKIFDHFNDVQSNPQKELVREYYTPEGDKVQEVGPIVYGYSMTIGPDGKPHVREFGNVKSFGGASGRGEIKPQITSEREPLTDVHSTDNEVKVVLEMPCVKKEDIKVNVSDGIIKVISNDPKRKYHKVIEVPHEADIETVRSTYSNGILEAIFKKKRETKPKGKEVKVE